MLDIAREVNKIPIHNGHQNGTIFRKLSVLVRVRFCRLQWVGFGPRPNPLSCAQTIDLFLQFVLTA